MTWPLELFCSGFVKKKSSINSWAEGYVYSCYWWGRAAIMPKKWSLVGLQDFVFLIWMAWTDTSLINKTILNSVLRKMFERHHIYEKKK